MSNQENKLLIKIGNHFEANATGNFAVAAVLLIVVVLFAVGFEFI